MNTTSNAVELALSDNAAEFASTINDILSDKLRERLNVEKVAVAQQFFNRPDEEDQELEDEEDSADEDV